MKEQQETNNASPAVPVNLKMWPSAPQEKEKGKETGEEVQRKGKEGRSCLLEAQSLPQTLLLTARQTVPKSGKVPQEWRVPIPLLWQHAQPHAPAPMTKLNPRCHLPFSCPYRRLSFVDAAPA